MATSLHIRCQAVPAVTNDVVLGPAAEIAHTIVFRLTLHPFAFGIPVPLVTADALRPIVLRRAGCGGTPEGADSRHCLQQLLTRIAQNRPAADRRQLAN